MRSRRSTNWALVRAGFDAGDAAYALDELAAGRMPDLERALQGLMSLDPLLLSGGHEQALHEAAATLELLVATGGTFSLLAIGDDRAGAMADAVRREIARV